MHAILKTIFSFTLLRHIIQNVFKRTGNQTPDANTIYIYLRHLYQFYLSLHVTKIHKH